MRVRVYIDGFNLYYGVPLQYGIKWVDIKALMARLLLQKNSSYRVEKIFLFSSKVLGEEDEQRQSNYFGAIKYHSPDIEIRLGGFKTAHKYGKNSQGKTVRVRVREEKETDVNIACRIVDDAHTSAGKDFDICCLVSNDGDLAEALRVKERLQQKTILIFPRAERSSHEQRRIACTSPRLKELVPQVDRIYVIKEQDLIACQLPPKVGPYEPPDSEGWAIQPKN